MYLLLIEFIFRAFILSYFKAVKDSCQLDLVAVNSINLVWIVIEEVALFCLASKSVTLYLFRITVYSDVMGEGRRKVSPLLPHCTKSYKLLK